MKTILYFYWQLCLLRKAPQDIPASPSLLQLTALVYVLLGTLLGSLGDTVLVGLVQAALDLLLMVGFLKLALTITGHQDRFVQTLTALLGSGLILSGLAVPLMLVRTLGYANQMPGLLWLWLFGWSILITGHILRHSLSVSLRMGVVLTFLYTFSVWLLVAQIMPAAPTAG